MTQSNKYLSCWNTYKKPWKGPTCRFQHFHARYQSIILRSGQHVTLIMLIFTLKRLELYELQIYIYKYVLRFRTDMHIHLSMIRVSSTWDKTSKVRTVIYRYMYQFISTMWSDIPVHDGDTLLPSWPWHWNTTQDRPKFYPHFFFQIFLVPYTEKRVEKLSIWQK